MVANVYDLNNSASVGRAYFVACCFSKSAAALAVKYYSKRKSNGPVLALVGVLEMM
jgi:hypothetical protein